MKKIAVLFLAIAISTNVQAQNFTYKAKVEKCANDGFYKIIVNANITQYAQSGLQDLRLMDNDGKEIPYLLKKQNESNSDKVFKEYTITKHSNNDTLQTLIIANPTKKSISNMFLQMKNVEASRNVKISGSDDQNKWFVVRDDFTFDGNSSEDTSDISNEITFATTNYGFYKLEIAIKNNEPLNISKAGNYETQITNSPNFSTITNFIYRRIDSSNKKTYLYFSSAKGNDIDRIIFKISDPKLYHRTIKILKPYEDYSAKKSLASMKSMKRNVEYQSENYELVSDVNDGIYVSGYLGENKPTQFVIEIENNDNQILKIDSVVLQQYISTITAELKANKNYFLYFGDSLLSFPSYDLGYFTKNIPEKIASLHTDNAIPKSVKVVEEANNQNDKYFVWIGLAIVGIILLLLSSSMLKNMKKNEA